MEASAVATETTPNGDQPTPSPETSPAEHQGATEMFQFSEYVHVGPGAEECEDKLNGSCGNPLHFHAWCRLPNQFQNASIRDKALAAKARKMRQLRDQATDAYEVLESEMDRLRRIGETEDGKAELVEEIVMQTRWKDQLTAVREVNDEEEWTTILEDQERYRHLSTIPEKDRPADEYEELERHLEKYDEAVKARREELIQPQRDTLLDLDAEALVQQIRDSRMDSEGNEDFMRVYSLWEWYTGTLKPRPVEKGLPNERVFGSVDHLQTAAPEVIEALEAAFGRLETAMGSKAALGNS